MKILHCLENVSWVQIGHQNKMTRRPVSSEFQNVDWNRNSIKVEYSSTGLMLSECCRQVVCSEKTNFAKLEKFSESKSLLLWIGRIEYRPLDFLNTCPLLVYFSLFIDCQYVAMIKDCKMNVWRRKIDDQRSSFSTCVSSKKCSPDQKTGLLLPLRIYREKVWNTPS